MKMKNFIKKFFIILIITGGIMSICSFSKNNLQIIEGYVFIYGNEPFTFVGIKTDKNKEYSISAGDDIKKELRNAQGKKIQITGSIIKPDSNNFELERLKDGKIEVSEWKIIK